MDRNNQDIGNTRDSARLSTTRVTAARIRPLADEVAADFPSLLASPRPRLRVYPRETVVSEKFEAMVQLGFANSRMKDFFDLRFLARSFEFDGSLLSAIAATFARRGTPIPVDIPVAFTPAFAEDLQKKAQWTGFLKGVGVADQT